MRDSEEGDKADAAYQVPGCSQAQPAEDVKAFSANAGRAAGDLFGFAVENSSSASCVVV